MKYIVDFNPIIMNDIDYYYYLQIENKIKNRQSLTNEEASDFLDIIGYITRLKINPNIDDFTNKCDLAVSILYHYLKDLDCEVSSSTTQSAITSNITGHSFLVLKLLVENTMKYYLLDPTYIQFFKSEKCNNSNYFISPLFKNTVLLTPDPGFFIKEEMKEYATFLLNHGHILLTEDVARMYGDSFYNTKTGTRYDTLTYQTIPGSVYISSFIKGGQGVSKTKQELIDNNLFIESFEELSQNIKQNNI